MTDNEGATMGDASKAVDAREQLAMAAGIHEDMGQKSMAVAIRIGVKEIDTLRARAERAEAELAALRAEIDAAPVVKFWLGEREDQFVVNSPEEAEAISIGQRVRLLRVGESGE